eukprot:gnl/Chilomastix_cuspidata/2793.p1 GENE.gnl/Chilomastix_cuspidata/2793~~gnl/Chilomastix_cuspidata/2793.p1  ORF type:complete len:1676 (+),score=298.55 gnl/Chilomastix_cuspidata/2793:725-5752(+)
MAYTIVSSTSLLEAISLKIHNLNFPLFFPYLIVLLYSRDFRITLMMLLLLSTLFCLVSSLGVLDSVFSEYAASEKLFYVTFFSRNLFFTFQALFPHLWIFSYIPKKRARLTGEIIILTTCVLLVAYASVVTSMAPRVDEEEEIRIYRISCLLFAGINVFSCVTLAFIPLFVNKKEFVYFKVEPQPSNACEPHDALAFRNRFVNSMENLPFFNASTKHLFGLNHVDTKSPTVIPGQIDKEIRNLNSASSAELLPQKDAERIVAHDTDETSDSEYLKGKTHRKMLLSGTVSQISLQEGSSEYSKPHFGQPEDILKMSVKEKEKNNFLKSFFKFFALRYKDFFVQKTLSKIFFRALALNLCLIAYSALNVIITFYLVSIIIFVVMGLGIALHIIAVVNLSALPCERIPDSPLSFPKSSTLMAKFQLYMRDNAQLLVLWRAIAIHSILANGSLTGPDDIILSALRDIVYGNKFEIVDSNTDDDIENASRMHNHNLTRPFSTNSPAANSKLASIPEASYENGTTKNYSTSTVSTKNTRSSSSYSRGPLTKQFSARAIPKKMNTHIEKNLYSINEGDGWVEPSDSSDFFEVRETIVMTEQNFSSENSHFKQWRLYWLTRIDELLEEEIDSEKNHNDTPLAIAEQIAEDAFRILMSSDYFSFMRHIRFTRLRNPNVVSNSEICKLTFLQSAVFFLQQNSLKRILIEPLMMFFSPLRRSKTIYGHLKRGIFSREPLSRGSRYLLKRMNFYEPVIDELAAFLSYRGLNFSPSHQKQTALNDDMYVLEYTQRLSVVPTVLRQKVNNIYVKTFSSNSDHIQKRSMDFTNSKNKTSLTIFSLQSASSRSRTTTTHTGKFFSSSFVSTRLTSSSLPGKTKPLDSRQLPKLVRNTIFPESEVDELIPAKTYRRRDPTTEPSDTCPSELKEDLPRLSFTPTNCMPQDFLDKPLKQSSPIRITNPTPDIPPTMEISPPQSQPHLTIGDEKISSNPESITKKTQSLTHEPSVQSFISAEVPTPPKRPRSKQDSTWISPKPQELLRASNLLQQSTLYNEYSPVSGPSTFFKRGTVQYRTKSSMQQILARIGYDIFPEIVTLSSDDDDSASEDSTLPTKAFTSADGTVPISPKAAPWSGSFGEPTGAPPASLANNLSSVEEELRQSKSISFSLTQVPNSDARVPKEGSQFATSRSTEKTTSHSRSPVFGRAREYCEKQIESWSFDSFHLQRISHDHPLLAVALEINEKYPTLFPLVFTPFSLSHFITFILKIESLYRSNPYHSAAHAADVLQFVHSTVMQIKQSSFLKRWHSQNSFRGSDLSREYPSGHKLSSSHRKEAAAQAHRAEPPPRQTVKEAFLKVTSKDKPFFSPEVSDATIEKSDSAPCIYSDNNSDALIHEAFMSARNNFPYLGRWISDSCHALLLLAAIIHDVDHLGFNNMFLAEIGHPLANVYCGTSILEAHSVSIGLNLMHECGFTTSDDFREFLRLLVLSTDNAYHTQILFSSRQLCENFESNQFSYHQLNEALKHIRPFDFDDTITNVGFMQFSDMKRFVVRARTILMQLIIKQSDINNQLRPKEFAYPWAESVLEEFYRFGDYFKAMGLSIGKFNERKDKSEKHLAECQVGFINFVVMPLQNQLQKMASLLCGVPKDSLLSNWHLSENLVFWKKLSAGDELRELSPAPEPSSSFEADPIT